MILAKLRYKRKCCVDPAMQASRRVKELVLPGQPAYLAMVRHHRILPWKIRVFVLFNIGKHVIKTAALRIDVLAAIRQLPIISSISLNEKFSGTTFIDKRGHLGSMPEEKDYSKNAAF